MIVVWNGFAINLKRHTHNKHVLPIKKTAKNPKQRDIAKSSCVRSSHMCESQMILVKITKLIYHFICISNYIKFDSHSSDEWHFNVKCRTLETEVLNAPDACSFARCSLQICNMHLVKYFIQKIFVSVVVFVRWLFLLLLLSSLLLLFFPLLLRLHEKMRHTRFNWAKQW